MKMTKKLKWEEFRNSGLLWFINNILHLFGRAICFDYNKNKKLKEVYFARCKFRGFDEKTVTKGFINLTNFIEKNIKIIKKDL
jgi:hypothetical protein